MGHPTKILTFVFALHWLTEICVAVDFAHDVVPILKQHCIECHGGDKAKGGFSLNTKSLFLEDDAASPGDAAKSYFLELIEETDPEYQMPPEKKDRVPAAQISILKQWIDEGMQWEPGFTFGAKSWEPPLQPREVDLPAITQGRIHPIDRLLDADLASREKPIPIPAKDSAFLRRATLDAIGLLPTPEELEKFLASTDPDKRTKMVDSLLAREIDYADHWLTMWNDLLRNDYTGTGFITKGRTQITPWLYSSLRENKPYDQFVRELIAPQPEAAGFINGIKWRGDVNASQTREIQFSQNISQVFLGINMKCASCHDSFIDGWKLEEAYNLAAIFSEEPLELSRCDKPTGVMAEAKWIFPELGDIDPALPKEERLSQLASLMTHPGNGRFTRTVVNRVWERLMGRGIVHPVDAMDTQPWNEDLLDYLAVQFAQDKYDLRKFIRFVMTSQAYQSRAVILEEDPGDQYKYAGPISKRMTAEQLLDTIWQITDTHPLHAEAKVDRVKESELKQSPLTLSNVKANWIWHQGKVGKKSELQKRFHLQEIPRDAVMMATCDNAFKFRLNGEQIAQSKEWTKPVYVDLIPHLKQGENIIEVDAEMHGGAAGFVCQIWFLSEETSSEIITDKSWLARPPGGKGSWSPAKEINPHGSQPWGVVMDPKNLPPTGPTPPVRAALVKNDFLMRSLGRPHRDQVVTSRPAELTTLQAIDLANGDLLAGYLKKGAENLVGSSHTDTNWLYRYALSRKPSQEEQTLLNEIIADGKNPLAMEDLLWLIFMQPEFQMIR